MTQAAASPSSTRDVIERPPLAVMVKEDLRAVFVTPAADPSHEARVRAAAYALYEARGQEHGHDVDDWLQAEAALAAANGPGGGPATR